MSDKDTGPEAAIKGAVEGVKGKVKEVAGAVTGRDDLQREGEAQQDKADSQREVARRKRRPRRPAPRRPSTRPSRRPTRASHPRLGVRRDGPGVTVRRRPGSGVRPSSRAMYRLAPWRTPGPLLASDEQLTHQIVDTFARVGESDRSWTEKICAMAAAKDGSMQLSLGLGKYTNRNVMDAYAGISRGVEQWTVRASRRLAPDPETTTVGPIHYEVVEPLREIRFALDPNDVLPIAFEWRSVEPVPPSVESREVHVSRDRFRIDADIIRYHQGGTASGWVEIDGAAHRARRDDLGLDPRPLVGRPVPGGRAAPGHRAGRPAGGHVGVRAVVPRLLRTAPTAASTACTSTTSGSRSETGAG